MVKGPAQLAVLLKMRLAGGKGRAIKGIKGIKGKMKEYITIDHRASM
jgi:hypothetical protein